MLKKPIHGVDDLLRSLRLSPVRLILRVGFNVLISMISDTQQMIHINKTIATQPVIKNSVHNSTGFVRPARAEDLTAIGQVQAATMLASLEAGHTAEHSAPLPEGVRAMIAAPVIAAGWEAAVTEPPSPEHHVLVATTAQADAVSRTVVGLLGLAPTQSMDAEGHVDEAGVQAVEVTALGVEPASQRRGHGSRLLAAAVDLARQDGARALVAWAVRGDESISRILTSVGMAPTGAHRVLGVGEGITEDCWAASL